jgi:hypothetical protein
MDAARIEGAGASEINRGARGAELNVPRGKVYQGVGNATVVWGRESWMRTVEKMLQGRFSSRRIADVPSVRPSGERVVELEHGGKSRSMRGARDRWRRRNTH